MPADRFDIEDLEIGSTFQLDVTIKGTDGAVVDLTNYLVRSKARKKYEDANAAFTFTTTIATPATDGKITMFLDATTTAGLTKGRYVYDLEIEDTAGIVTKIIKGSILVTPEATK